MRLDYFDLCDAYAAALTGKLRAFSPTDDPLVAECLAVWVPTDGNDWVTFGDLVRTLREARVTEFEITLNIPRTMAAWRSGFAFFCTCAGADLEVDVAGDKFVCRPKPGLLKSLEAKS